MLLQWAEKEYLALQIRYGSHAKGIGPLERARTEGIDEASDSLTRHILVSIEVSTPVFGFLREDTFRETQPVSLQVGRAARSQFGGSMRAPYIFYAAAVGFCAERCD